MKEFLKKNGEKIIFTVYIAFYLLFAIAMMLNQPFSDFVSGRFLNPPDESARYLIPKYICKYGTLPVGYEDEVQIGAYGFSYALYNIFPYIIQGFIMRFVNLFTDDARILLLTARGVNVCFGLIMAVIVYLLGKRVFKNKYIKWLFAFMVTFLPEALFVHTYVNTDSCALLATALMIYALVVMYQDGPDYKNGGLLALGVSLAALSYYNAYGAILSAAILFVGYFVSADGKKVRFDYKSFFKYGLFALGLVVLMSAWWFIRSYIVLDGDFLGLETRRKMQELYAVSAVKPGNSYKAHGISILTMIVEKRFFWHTYQTFVAAYGSLTILLSRKMYLAYMLIHGIGGVAWVTAMVNAIRKYDNNGKKLFWNAVMVIMSVIPILLLLRYAYATEYAEQGRYVLPGLISLMLMLATGFDYLFSSEKLQSKVKKYPGLLPKLGTVLIITLILYVEFTIVFKLSLPLFEQWKDFLSISFINYRLL